MSSKDFWPLRLVLEGTAPDGAYLRVTAGLSKLAANPEPYWSFTAEEWQSKARFDAHLDCCACGCLHDEIGLAYPWLVPLIRLHLSDDQGVPMHALANALYHAGLTQYPEARNPDRLADHLRISLFQATEFCAWKHLPDAEQGEARQAARVKLTLFVKDQRPRWAEESEAVKRILIERGAVAREAPK